MKDTIRRDEKNYGIKHKTNDKQETIQSLYIRYKGITAAWPPYVNIHCNVYIGGRFGPEF